MFTLDVVCVNEFLDSLRRGITWLEQTKCANRQIARRKQSCCIVSRCVKLDVQYILVQNLQFSSRSWDWNSMVSLEQKYIWKRRKTERKTIYTMLFEMETRKSMQPKTRIFDTVTEKEDAIMRSRKKMRWVFTRRRNNTRRGNNTRSIDNMRYAKEWEDEGQTKH